LAAHEIAVRHVAESVRLGYNLFGELHEPTEGGDAAGPDGFRGRERVLGGGTLRVGAGSGRGFGRQLGLNCLSWCDRDDLRRGWLTGCGAIG
jgi:hypothetical protein